MSARALTERLAELAGPIVVKEIRQGLRARVFGICFGALLLGCFIVALIATTDSDLKYGIDTGPHYFRLFLTGLALVEFFVIPYVAYRAMARETEDETWVLLVLTGLGPKRIVRGKIASALAQGALYGSAAVPFVLFSYYLNGIDLPTVVVALVLAAAWSTLLICFAVAVATQAKSRLGRGLVHFLVLGVLGVATVMGIAWSEVLSRDGGRLISSDSTVERVCVALFVWSVTSAWLLSEAAPAGLSLVSENASYGARRALFVQLLIVAATAEAVATVHELALVLALFTSLHLFFCGAFAVSERDGFSRAFVATPGWSRPGALRSFLFIVGLLVGCFVCAAAAHRASAMDSRYVLLALAAPLYALLYLSLGVVVGRATRLNRLGEPLATRIAVAGLALLGCTVPALGGYVFRHDTVNVRWNMLNPILGMRNLYTNRVDPGEAFGHLLGYGHHSLVVLGASALLATLVAWTLLSKRDVERRA